MGRTRKDCGPLLPAFRTGHRGLSAQIRAQTDRGQMCPGGPWRQTGPGLCLGPQVLRITLGILCALPGQWGQREEKGTMASVRICSTLADNIGEPVPGRSEFLATEESVLGSFCLSSWHRRTQNSGMCLSVRMGARMSGVEPQI